MRTVLFLVCLTLVALGVTAAEPCNPLYWDFDPEFTASNNEGEIYSQSPLYPNDLTRNKYAISEVKGINTFDGSQRVITNENNTSITVSNNIMNIAFTFTANKNKTITNVSDKAYSGVGTATVTQVVFNYTKKLTVTSAGAMFDIVNVNYFLPNAFVPGKYSPEPVTSDKTEFDKLVKENLYAEVNSLINGTIRDALKRICDKQSFTNLFGGNSFTYTYNQQNITLNTTINEVVFASPKGRSVGYDAGFNNFPRPCSSFVPDSTNDKGTYLSMEMISHLAKGYSAYSTAWSALQFDSSYKNDNFQFLIIDLEEIVPKALQLYPSILSKLVVTCAIDHTSLSIGPDGDNNLLSVYAKWNCEVSSVSYNATLLKMMVPVTYDVKITQEGSALKVRATSLIVDPTSVVWTQASENLPIANTQIANLYLKSVLPRVLGSDFFGNGFPQPVRKSPTVVVADKYVEITENLGQTSSLRVE